MISWIDIKDKQPELNAWILVTYPFKGKCGNIIWTKRIAQWTKHTHLRRRVTHWTHMNNPQ